ncbi:hypothetical protein ACI2KR_07135 [Pseudomonas luteola]
MTPESRSNRLRLDPALLEKALKSKFAFHADELVVIFQGGEPSTVGENALLEYAECVTKVLPKAKLAMVSNLYHVSDWLIDFARGPLSGRLETTYAGGRKYSLSGNPSLFQDRFANGLKKCVQSGLEIPVNVELNRETLELGVDALIDLASHTGAKIWEFDFSVDFDQFRTFSLYDSFGYPILPKTVSYDDFYGFVLSFAEKFEKRLGYHVQSGVVDQFRAGTKSINFNVQREADFVTINPDGMVTTNPLFSDLSPTFLGNLNQSNLDECLANSARSRRIMRERHRVIPCMNCVNFHRCGGGVSHLPVRDSGVTCIGGYQYWMENE